jgi:hypothetical protein
MVLARTQFADVATLDGTRDEPMSFVARDVAGE